MTLRRAALEWTFLSEEVCVFENTERKLGAHTLFLVEFEGAGDSDEPCGAACVRRAGVRPRNEVEEHELQELNLALRGFEQREAVTT